jgi:hypothetical protein
VISRSQVPRNGCASQNPGLYRVGATTGLETAIAALLFGFSSGLELMN